MDFDPKSFSFWPAFFTWLMAMAGFAGTALVVATVISLAVKGVAGPVEIAAAIARGFREISQTSFKRVWALTTLTVRESIRRKVVLVGVIFLLLFMFANWFLSGSSNTAHGEAKVYVSFVLTSISWLILPVVLLLSCWGLPEDIRLRSLHTVVTKPARRSEIVLGRMLGFTAVGTLVLLPMALVAYVWIVRQVSEEEDLVSRVPVYGTLVFLDRSGSPTEKGINTGDIWEFRSYIEGATRSRAVWDFDDIYVDPSEKKMRMESSFQSFRTHKGDIVTKLLAQFIFVNEDKDLRVPLPPFEVEEFRSNVHEIDRKLTYFDETTNTKRTVDLFDDIVQDGHLQVEVLCIDQQQYLGMARPDLFIRPPDRPFASGYFKAIAGLWLKIALIVAIGVTASCFLKGPVATLLTFVLIIVGQGLRTVMDKIAAGQLSGGGPVEAWYRVVKHLNPMVALPDNPLSSAMQAVDNVIVGWLWLIKQIIPDFNIFTMAPYVANGFDVPWSASLLPSIAVTIAYVIPCFLLGYFALANRELESK